MEYYYSIIQQQILKVIFYLFIEFFFIIFNIVNRGDRIAQVIIEKITDTEIIEVEDLNDTERGQGGFGSTGISQENIIDDSINISINFKIIFLSNFKRKKKN